ncbi:MAG: NAD(P)H-hydrate dehydratase [Oscillospiraceae bacterium]
MNYVVTNAQMREAEQRCAQGFVSLEQLMINAGIACAEKISQIIAKVGSVVILCGSGNNGGDGMVIAGILGRTRDDVRVIFVNGMPKSDCAKSNAHFLFEQKNVSYADYTLDSSCVTWLENAGCVIDCVYGTGFHGVLSESIARIIAAANHVPVRIAVDVPSGVNSDSGEFDENCFRPTNTLVLGAMKYGLLMPDCNDILGEITLLDIGIPKCCYENNHLARLADDSFRRPFGERRRNSHKGSFGRLLNIAGSRRYMGAAAMSTNAALRSGVGLCTLAAPECVVNSLSSAIFESTFLPLPETDDGFAAENAAEFLELDKVTAISIGCGLGCSDNTRRLTEFVIRNASCPIILDADGINSIAGNIDILKERNTELIITPHPLEFSRITGLAPSEIFADRIGNARAFAKKYGVTVLLKGANTVIASPNDDVIINTTGNSGLAKGGSGDVLTGIIAAFAAQGIDTFTAAASGAYCHGLAADILAERLPPQSILARDVIETLPEVYRSF